MSKNMIGTMPTAYGTAAAVYAFDDPNDPEATCFDVDGVMDLAGLYGQEEGAKCKAAINECGGNGGKMFALVIHHGGQPVPRVPLTPVQSTDNIYHTIPVEFGCRDVTDAWITRTADETRWSERAKHLIEMITGNAEHFSGSLPEATIGFVLSKILTATLENLGESQINCLEAAAFYALCEHPQWRAAGIEWLTPFRQTWFADWVQARQDYRRFARMVIEVYDDLPRWLAGGRPA